MDLFGAGNLLVDNNNTGLLELRGNINRINSSFIQQRATGGTAGASGATAGVKIGSSGVSGSLISVTPGATTTPYALNTSFAVTITGAGVLTPAIGNAFTNGAGAITSISLLTLGSGYINGNIYNVTGGTGAATVTAIANTGVNAVLIAGTNTGGASIQFQGSEIGRVTNILKYCFRG